MQLSVDASVVFLSDFYLIFEILYGLVHVAFEILVKSTNISFILLKKIYCNDEKTLYVI
ncbi:hypothetical protein PDY_19400 [Photobacterium damselae subsp. damselae]|nr:hypothetical protein PDY_19400 [Photobacterium damselae subsp. damselae]